jgi:hypothetical protein
MEPSGRSPRQPVAKTHRQRTATPTLHWARLVHQRPGVPYEDDYLFASPALAGRLRRVWRSI